MFFVFSKFQNYEKVVQKAPINMLRPNLSGLFVNSNKSIAIDQFTLEIIILKYIIKDHSQVKNEALEIFLFAVIIKWASSVNTNKNIGDISAYNNSKHQSG